MNAYYNEFDPFAAAWLRNLIKANLIAPGEVDDRSIRDVGPEDLRGFRQHHFFAGIGGWSLALRLAGWPDDESVWTASCPCQPFSSAGAGGGFEDERHLWPDLFRLARELRPPVLLGEQVASPDALRWLDLVFGDLEGQDYACGAADLCSAGVGAPNIRQRIYWMAHAMPAGRPGAGCGQASGSGIAGGLGDTHQQGRQGRQGEPGDDGAELAAAERAGGEPGAVANPDGRGHDGRRPSEAGDGRDAARIEPERLCDARRVGLPHGDGPQPGDGRPEADRYGGSADAAGSPHFWSDADWLPCQDGKLRPTKPGLFPLASGVPGKVGKLRGAGNAINPELAAEFIRAARGVMP